MWALAAIGFLIGALISTPNEKKIENIKKDKIEKTRSVASETTKTKK